ncbi:uncharacterized protein LOC128711178 [Anopheles marshallii]|uniref:uncharacterized protein LOC128711178 n=1 Tax=Anopheles marshallii TaxID=1521116 RepID=UPI00237B2610|nr:uncharacterized protein LOC128711178 [Anopheles marshallii]
MHQQNYALPPYTTEAPLGYPSVRIPAARSTTIEEELKRIDKQCEDQLLEERLRAIERCELRRMAEKKRLLEDSVHASTSIARQHEETYRAEPYRPSVSFVPVQPERTMHRSIRNNSTIFPSFNQSQISARKCTSKELPIFGGDPKEWMAFISYYEHSTAICGYTNGENMLRLQACLKGKAREAVGSCLLYPDSIPEAIEILKECYSRPEIVVNTLMANIRRMPPPKDDSFDALVNYGVAVRNFCASIAGSGLHSYFDGGPLLEELVDKLPTYVRLNWYYYQNDCTHVTLATFNDWVKELVRAASRGVKHTSGRREVKHDGNNRQHDRKYAHQNVHSTGLSVKPVSKSPVVEVDIKRCVACQEKCVNLSDCGKFQAMSVNARWTLIKREGLCRTCLCKHSSACPVGVLCGINGCERRHHRLLHSPGSNQVQPNTSQEGGPVTTNCNVHSVPPGGVMLKYIPVTLYGNGTQVDTMALLDDGSSATFMEHDLLKELGISGKPRPLCISWTGNQSRVEDKSVELSVRISGVGIPGIYNMRAVHTVRTLGLSKQSLAPSQLAVEYDHLRGLPLPSYHNISARILIGVDNCFLSQILKTVEGRADEPAASKTRLGWVVYGPYQQTSKDAITKRVKSMNLHICPCSENRDSEMDLALRKYFSFESLGVYHPVKQLRSGDEERALNILASKVRLIDGRYEAGLLWKYETIKLPDSRAMALRRHDCLERKLRRDPHLAKAMHTKIIEYEERGYIRKLTPTERSTKDPNDWYLPIFPVINPNKPGKVRVVFDAAAKVNGLSLNSVLLTGPDQLVGLLTVLYKFREYKIAVTGDIREMFFQVRMNERDQRSQMFFSGTMVRSVAHQNSTY